MTTSTDPIERSWDLSLYELHRTPQEAITDETEIAVSARSLQSELTCPICLDMLTSTMTTKECLHRQDNKLVVFSYLPRLKLNYFTLCTEVSNYIPYCICFPGFVLNALLPPFDLATRSVQRVEKSQFQSVHFDLIQILINSLKRYFQIEMNMKRTRKAFQNL